MAEALLSDQPNANHAFILASQEQIERDAKLTDEELRLAHDLLHRVSIKTMPSSGHESK